MVDEHDVGERLAAIETRLDIMGEQWDKRITQDTEHQKDVSDKLEALLIDRAVRTGEEKSLRKVAGWVSFLVASLISAVAMFANHLMGGS